MLSKQQDSRAGHWGSLVLFINIFLLIKADVWFKFWFSARLRDWESVCWLCCLYWATKICPSLALSFTLSFFLCLVQSWCSNSSPANFLPPFPWGDPKGNLQPRAEVSQSPVFPGSGDRWLIIIPAGDFCPNGLLQSSFSSQSPEDLGVWTDKEQWRRSTNSSKDNSWVIAQMPSWEWSQSTIPLRPPAHLGSTAQCKEHRIYSHSVLICIFSSAYLLEVWLRVNNWTPGPFSSAVRHGE